MFIKHNCPQAGRPPHQMKRKTGRAARLHLFRTLSEVSVSMLLTVSLHQPRHELGKISLLFPYRRLLLKQDRQVHLDIPSSSWWRKCTQLQGKRRNRVRKCLSVLSTVIHLSGLDWHTYRQAWSERKLSWNFPGFQAWCASQASAMSLQRTVNVWGLNCKVAFYKDLYGT